MTCRRFVRPLALVAIALVASCGDSGHLLRQTNDGGAGSGGAGGTLAGSGGGGSGAGGTANPGGGRGGSGAGGTTNPGSGGGGGSAGFTLTSPAFTEGMMFPAENTCAGVNTSPELDWTAGPSGTMSYAIVLVDLTGGLAQWAIWNIPPDVRSLPAMLPGDATLSSPAAAVQVSSSGHGYAGPCPNGSMHTYYFVVYAVPVANLPQLTSSSSPETVHLALTSMAPSALLIGTSDAKSP